MGLDCASVPGRQNGFGSGLEGELSDNGSSSAFGRSSLKSDHVLRGMLSLVKSRSTSVNTIRRKGWRVGRRDKVFSRHCRGSSLGWSFPTRVAYPLPGSHPPLL